MRFKHQYDQKDVLQIVTQKEAKHFPFKIKMLLFQSCQYIVRDKRTDLYRPLSQEISADNLPGIGILSRSPGSDPVAPPSPDVPLRLPGLSTRSTTLYKFFLLSYYVASK